MYTNECQKYSNYFILTTRSAFFIIPSRVFRLLYPINRTKKLDENEQSKYALVQLPAVIIIIVCNGTAMHERECFVYIEKCVSVFHIFISYGPLCCRNWYVLSTNNTLALTLTKTQSIEMSHGARTHTYKHHYPNETNHHRVTGIVRIALAYYITHGVFVTSITTR